MIDITIPWHWESIELGYPPRIQALCRMLEEAAFRLEASRRLKRFDRLTAEEQAAVNTVGEYILTAEAA